MAFKDKINQSMVYTKTKVRPPVLTHREMVQEEVEKQRKLLADSKSTGSWWDKKNDCVTVTVKGASYFNEGGPNGNSGRIYGKDYLNQAWSAKTVKTFINEFETALQNDEFIQDTEYWSKRYKSKISGSKGRVKGKGKVTKKK